MLKIMKRGSVIVDVAIDQGGCVETSKPTTFANPTYIVDDIIHYCVANMPGAVPMTSTISLTNSTSSYVLDLLKEDLFSGKIKSKAILKGINIYKGKVMHKGLSESFKMKYHNPLKIFNT